MPRDYKKKPGTRRYINYSDESLNEALSRVVTGAISLRAASREYNIPFGTLYNKYKGNFTRTPGAQPIFSHNEEKSLLKAAAKCSDWGYPLTALDLRFLAKAYLDKQGRHVARFHNNLPGPDWAYSILKRHKDEYSTRVAANIKRARAEVSREALNVFFDNLEPLIKDVPASNIFNYDESNLSDDPGKQQGIFRRGVKYPERVTNFSKSATSIMICGSANGVMLPPYVIYKSQHLYETWKEGAPSGPPCCNKRCCSGGTSFNRTSSGWFDSETFRDWFIQCFLPHAKDLPGRKVMIGDNLSSHLDTDVIRLCAENEIDFVCLVPHSTHLCQPLDVAFFRPMKAAWRAILSEWKAQNMRMTSVPKDTFPRLLTKALHKMNSAQAKPNTPFCTESSGIKRNLRSGFKATGIFPFDKEQVLKRLPDNNLLENADAPVESVLTDYLRTQRFGHSSSSAVRRRTRLNLAPGASASTTIPGANKELPGPSSTEANEELPGPSSTEANEELPGPSYPEANEELLGPSSTLADFDTNGNEICVGRYVLAKFFTPRGKKTFKYVCRVIDTSPHIVVIGYKSLGNKTVFELVRSDISDIEKCDIISFLPEPKSLDEEEPTSKVEFPFDVDILELK